MERVTFSLQHLSFPPVEGLELFLKESELGSFTFVETGFEALLES